MASITSKANPERSQKAYRLDAIREGATRFGAKLHHGLTTFVGRDPELEKLERGFDAIRSGVQVFDIVGEPGIGKSRLVHEFVGQIVKERARVLVGSCTPDGQQTPFRAFIEIVRGAYRLGPEDLETVVARKLGERVSKRLGLRSPENLALLLNMLGLKAPEGALASLDGVLIGFAHTRTAANARAGRRSRLDTVDPGVRGPALASTARPRTCWRRPSPWRSSGY